MIMHEVGIQCEFYIVKFQCSAIIQKECQKSQLPVNNMPHFWVLTLTYCGRDWC
jgi:hypothetical protein